jgi:hypothetical protein
MKRGTLKRSIHARLAAALFVALLVIAVACGDGVVLFAVRLGTVVSDADCHGDNGSFNLRDQQGLTVLVIITGDTQIVLATGARGTCHDLIRNSPVEVRGTGRDGTVNAQSVRLQY